MKMIKLLIEEQSGFRVGHSTIDNMLLFVQRYLIKRSSKVYVRFVDFKKAFDTINKAEKC